MQATRAAGPKRSMHDWTKIKKGKIMTKRGSKTCPNSPKAKTGKGKKKKKKEDVTSYGRKQRKRSSGGQDDKSDYEQQTKMFRKGENPNP